jgi:hypothetical protein
MRPSQRARTLLLWLEGLLALGAFGGAAGLITGGVDLGPAAADLPFGSTVFGGWALAAVNGVLPTIVLVGALRRATWARLGHHLVGAALIGWIVVQVAFLGWPPHWLQTTYFLYGWAILVLAIVQPRASTPPTEAAAPPRQGVAA